MSEARSPRKLSDGLGPWPNSSLFKPQFPNLKKRSVLMMKLLCFLPFLGCPVLRGQPETVPQPSRPCGPGPWSLPVSDEVTLTS